MINEAEITQTKIYGIDTAAVVVMYVASRGKACLVQVSTGHTTWVDAVSCDDAIEKNRHV